MTPGCLLLIIVICFVWLKLLLRQAFRHCTATLHTEGYITMSTHSHDKQHLRVASLAGWLSQDVVAAKRLAARHFDRILK
jgi:hypothetical protein